MNQKQAQSVFKIFNPGKDFPAISISGTQCKLDCAHCGGKYLKQMLAIDSPDSLLALCEDLDARGADGALISSGCDFDGHTMLDEYIDTLAMVKSRTNLILNVHTGLITSELANQLAKTNVDIASVDVVGDFETIKNVYGLHHRPIEYKNILQAFDRCGMKSIVPHVCIGLNFGQITGEFSAIDLISSIVPTAIVFIILIPTKGTKMAECSPPTIDNVLSVIKYARSKFANTPLQLGCMRPRSHVFRAYRREIEIGAIKAGINGIVLPAKTTEEYLHENGYSIQKYKTCCAVC